ncbi:hypothetical protein ACW7GZ_13880 [Luteimonas sp. A537]
MMRLIAAVFVFFVAWVLISIVFRFVGLWGMGLFAGLLAVIPAWLVYRRVGEGAAKGGVPAVASSNSSGSAATFSWKGVDVYQDQGFFTYRGREYQIANVTRTSYETSGRHGCMGGTHYKVHIHMKDMQMPRVTIGAGNVTAGGNDDTERNYERLGIALGCH